MTANPSQNHLRKRQFAKTTQPGHWRLKMNTDYGLFQLFLATKSMRERSERWLTTDKRSNESRLAEIDFSLMSRRIFVSGTLQGRTTLQMGLELVLPPLPKMSREFARDGRDPSKIAPPRIKGRRSVPRLATGC